MQFENLTKGQFIRDFKDTLHQEQLIRVAKAHQPKSSQPWLV